MNNSINYSGFVDLLKKSALEITHHAESLDGELPEPGQPHMVKPIFTSGTLAMETVGQDE